MLERILIISLIINGIDLVTSEGYIFYTFRKGSKRLFYGKYAAIVLKEGSAFKKKYYGWLHDPIIGCIVCMASFWGTLLYWGWFYFLPFDNAWLWYVPSLLAIAVLNPIISKLIDGKG